jgi:hypothetical protein
MWFQDLPQDKACLGPDGKDSFSGPCPVLSMHCRCIVDDWCLLTRGVHGTRLDLLGTIPPSGPAHLNKFKSTALLAVSPTSIKYKD